MSDVRSTKTIEVTATQGIHKDEVELTNEVS